MQSENGACNCVVWRLAIFARRQTELIFVVRVTCYMEIKLPLTAFSPRSYIHEWVIRLIGDPYNDEYGSEASHGTNLRLVEAETAFKCFFMGHHHASVAFSNLGDLHLGIFFCLELKHEEVSYIQHCTWSTCCDRQSSRHPFTRAFFLS